MKIVQVNSTSGIGSTGRICESISKLLSEKHVDNYILYSIRHSDYHLAVKYVNESVRKAQSLFEKIFGHFGFGAIWSTLSLVSFLKRTQPNIVHLHNIHSHDCNLRILFNYLRKCNIKVFWTFHDCWAFTGYCTHYDLIGCNKWQTECCECPQYKQYSFFHDRSRLNFKGKLKSYGDHLQMTIVTPSQWLAGQVAKSFLRNHDVKVINNGIDLTVFKPTCSDFKERNSCTNKFLILGVSMSWTYEKGYDVFNYLADKLDNRFQIVLVGTTSGVHLSEKIISIERTHNIKQLVEIYSAADLLVNTSREENYPTVNLEAIACGTPVVAFDSGGSRETILKDCGDVVPRDDNEALLTYILNVQKKYSFDRQLCVKEAIRCNDQVCYQNYLKLYGIYEG